MRFPQSNEAPGFAFSRATAEGTINVLLLCEGESEARRRTKTSTQHAQLYKNALQKETPHGRERESERQTELLWPRSCVARAHGGELLGIEPATVHGGRRGREASMLGGTPSVGRLCCHGLQEALPCSLMQTCDSLSLYGVILSSQVLLNTRSSMRRRRKSRSVPLIRREEK